LHRFRPRLADALRSYDRSRLIADVGAGLAVGVVALPLAMAFAIASGVKPEQGLITAIVAGFLISALGGSSVQIGGPAGAFIVIVYGIVQRYGLTNLLIATALAGGVMVAMGWLRLGTLVRYVPVQIIIGFTNGIAVLIAVSQLKDLLGLHPPKVDADFFSQAHAVLAYLGDTNAWALGLGLACFAFLFTWQRVSPRLGRVAARVPGPVIVLVVATAVTALLHVPVDTIGTRFGGIPQTLPALDLPPFSWASAKELVIPTLTIALLGAVESLLCARVADQLTTLPKHDPNQELMAQGIANLVAPAFGGIPATGTIARTVTNVRAGATSPVAGMVHALTLLAVVLAAAPLAASVPLPALAGLLLHVAWNMGEWREFSRTHLRRFTLPYQVVLLGTFVLTVVFDLMVAVQLGLVGACGFFIWRMGQLFRARPDASASSPGLAVLRLQGALFFGAVGKIEALPDSLPPGTRMLVLEMHRLIWIDASGLDALVQLHRQLQRAGIGLWLCGLADEPLDRVRQGGLAALIGTDHVLPTLADTLQALHALQPAAPQAGGRAAA
jgi:SulP family sulfate permease